jgi:Protein of unknown function (DUF2752)
MEVSIIPKLFFSRLSFSDEQKIDLNIFLSSFFLVLIFIPLAKYIVQIPHFCLIQKVFGIPCPACGTIRSIFYLSKCEVLASIRLHPAGIAIVAFFVAQLPFRLTSFVFPTLHHKVSIISKSFSKVVIVLLFSNWFIKLLTFL